MKHGQYTYHFAKHEGQLITCASKKKTVRFLLVVEIPGVKGVTLIDGFPTERTALNYAKREGWDRYTTHILPASDDKPEGN